MKLNSFKTMVRYAQIALFLGALHLSALPASAAEVNLLGFGDWGNGGGPEQKATAARMASYAKQQTAKFDAALLLGDNFYMKMPGGVSDPRWQVEFEQMYDAKALPMPFYAALGNHDYEQDKEDTEQAYAKQHPESRWKMPAKWYRVEIPAARPVVSVLVLDSNVKELKDEWKTELAWLKAELSKPRPGQWIIATAHHPVFSNGQHGDATGVTQPILDDWGALFKEHKLDFFLCGHDHDLQHLEVDGWPTSFILAGGGGAKIRVMKRDDRGPFSRSLNGFFHLQFTPEQAHGRFISSTGELVHEFTRTASGKVKVIKTSGRDKAKGKDKGEDK